MKEQNSRRELEPDLFNIRRINIKSDTFKEHTHRE